MFDRFDVVYQPRKGKNWQKLLNISEISRFRSLNNRASLKISENLREGPGIMGSTEERPSTPSAWGTSKYTFFRKKNDFFAKNPKFFQVFLAIFSTTNNRRIMKFS